MTEKPKKSKKRIPQWQFLIAWISGQYGAFFGTAFLGFLLMIPLSWMGISIDIIHPVIQFLIAGVAVGWTSGWVQQWSIRKAFGHDVKGWRSISAILTSISLAIVGSLIGYLALAQPLLFENQETMTYTAIVAATFMSIFGAAGLGQAILLRKHIKHSWLFFLSTLVGGLMFGLPLLGDSTYITVQIAQYSVTAFTILWLFGMSGTMDAMRSEDSAIDRLSDAESEDVYDDDYEEEQQYERGNLWKNLFRRLGFAI